PSERDGISCSIVTGTNTRSMLVRAAAARKTSMASPTDLPSWPSAIGGKSFKWAIRLVSAAPAPPESQRNHNAVPIMRPIICGLRAHCVYGLFVIYRETLSQVVGEA